MSDLMLPPKGKSAASLLQDLNADHAPDTTKNEETNVTTLQETNDASNQETSVLTNSRSNELEDVSGPVDFKSTAANQSAGKNNQRGRTKAAEHIQATDPATQNGTGVTNSGRAERNSRALEQAADDEITVVTVRVSGRLNEYMDRYVERMNRIHPKRRYRKQDAVAEAFAAFYADHPMPPAPQEDDL